MSLFRKDNSSFSQIKELLDGIHSASKRLLNYDKIKDHYRSAKYLMDVPGLAKTLLHDLEHRDVEVASIVLTADMIRGHVTSVLPMLLEEVELGIEERQELEHLNNYSQAFVQVAYINSSDSMKNPVNFSKLQAIEKQTLVEDKLSELNEKLSTYSKEIENRAGNVGMLLVEMQKNIEEKQREVLEKYEKTSAKLDEKSNELMKLSEELSNKALSGGYAVKGREELDKAESFRNGTFVMMLFIAGLLWHFAFDGKTKTLGADTFVHISLVFGLLIPTTYFARESGKHRSLGNRYLETGLYLTTLNPYMASMGEDAKDKIKTDLAGKLFFSFDNREHTDSMPINTQEVIMKAMDLASKAGRK